jgi:hypothetical protein
MRSISHKIKDGREDSGTAMWKPFLNSCMISICVFSLLCASCTRKADRSDERPAGRGYHAMAYDSESKRVILFGGQTGNIEDYPEIFFSGETWAYDPIQNRWQEMAPKISPPAMSAQAMAYDCKSDRMILHGGGGIFEKGKFEDAILNQTWAYDFNNNTWTRMSDGPARLGHQMAYDLESDRVVMFSGACFRDGRFQDVQETWAYDFNHDTWTEMNPAASPAPRHYHGMAYDKKSDSVTLWGGFLGKTAPDSSVWLYDFNSNSWTEQKPESGPGARWYHAMAYEEASGKILIYGGGDEGTDESWAYEARSNIWMKLGPATNPGTISRMPMVFVPDTGRMVLFGGQLDSRQYTYSDATWLYDLNINAWSDVTVRGGEYFGQRKPGIIPEVFAPGVVSTVYLEHSAVAFSPDGKEAYWTGDFRDVGRTEGRIFCAIQENGIWSSPRMASFSENLNCYNPVFSNDGRAVYFFAQLFEEGEESTPHIYRVEREKKGWSEPSVVDIPGMKGYLMTQFCFAKNGTLYFSTDSDEGHGSFDVFRSRSLNGYYTEPENLGKAVNSEFWDSYPYADPEERFLIFTSMGRPDGKGGMDLYICFRNRDGTWTQAKNMGDRINTKGVEALTGISPDGKWLFFVSDRNGNVDVYWVDAGIIDELKPESSGAIIAEAELKKVD